MIAFLTVGLRVPPIVQCRCERPSRAGNHGQNKASYRTATLSDSRSKLVILGIVDDGLTGLTEPARRLLMASDLILGAPATLSLLETLPGRKQALEPDMSVALRQVREALASKSPVLVSSGDPLFYGV